MRSISVLQGARFNREDAIKLFRFTGPRGCQRGAAEVRAEPADVDGAGHQRMEVPLWYGLWAPSGMAPKTVARYNARVTDILRAPDIVERSTKQGIEAVGGRPGASAVSSPMA